MMKNKHQCVLLMCCKESETLPVWFRHVHSWLEAVQEDVSVCTLVLICK